MKKVALCLPSYNESENIQLITHLIDLSINGLETNYDFVIVNCDNNSPDNTNLLFKKTLTRTKKVSILTNKSGKGINIYNFLSYCKREKIDYAITIDSDTKSFENYWIIKILNALENGYDFVYPKYRRIKEEGNTTNHFATLVLYSLYGIFIRQPIGGDYGFNAKYINVILSSMFTENILKYGIDFFMVATAIVKNMKLCEVNLGIKKHGVSYKKMKNIFEGVVNGAIETYEQYPYMKNATIINYQPYNICNEKWLYRKEFDNEYCNLLKEFNYKTDEYEKIENDYLDMLCNFLYNISNIDKSFINKLTKMFVLQSVSFWDKVDEDNDEQWERKIVRNCEMLRKKYENRNSE